MQVSGIRWGRIVRAVATAGALVATMGMAIGAQAATSASCTLGATASCSGLSIVGPHIGDSFFTSGTVGGQSADIFQKNTTPGNNPTAYIYFQVAKGSPLLSDSTLYLTVQYYDQAQGATCTKAAPCFWTADYDSTVASAPVNGAYNNIGSQVNLGGTAAWITKTFKLANASLKEGENNSADFRIDGTIGLAVHQVTLSDTAPTVSTSAPASTTTGSSGSSSAPASGSSSSSSSLPKTGGSPLVPVAGGLLLLGGISLALPRLRRSKAS